MHTYKRTSRHLSTTVRQQISNSLKGRTKTEAEKQAISDSMKRYWADDGNFPADVKK